MQKRMLNLDDLASKKDGSYRSIRNTGEMTASFPRSC
jgi:hypothetical protein